MAPEQQEFPSNPMNQDLYSQIAASDIEPVVKKPRQSFVMSFMIDVMRLTLLLDEKRRVHQKLFRFMGGVWAAFMALLYTSGLVMVGILVYSYIQFPNLVQNYFARNGILFEKMEIPGYVVSTVKLKGLHDKDNSYWIDSLTVNSNFGDFLQGRVKSVVLNGVRLSLEKVSQTSKPNVLIPLLMHLNDTRKTNLSVRVDSLEIQNAVLTIKGMDFELPIQFTLTGIYGHETNMSAYLTVNKPALALQGPLLIRGDKNGTTFSLDVHTGHVAIPGRPPEDMTGQISLSTQKEQVQSFQGKINLVQNSQEKVAKLDLTRDGDNTFRGSLDLSWLNVTDQEKREERTNVVFNLMGLQFNKQGLITTDRPIAVSFRTKDGRFQIGRLNTQLKGKLECLMLDHCSYRLEENARVSISQLKFPFQSEQIQSSRESSISVRPSDQLLSFPFREGRISFEAGLGGGSFTGRRGSDNGSVSFRAGQGGIRGEWNVMTDLVSAALNMERVHYQTPDYEFTDTRLEADNVFNSDTRIKINSPKVSFKKSQWFKKPFALDYETQKGVDRIAINFPEERVRILVNGIFNPATGYMDAQVAMPPVELANFGSPLSDFSAVFPADIQTASGRIAMTGRLFGTIKNGVAGPLSLALDGVSLKTERLVVDGMSTVLQIQTLQPFVTAQKQPVFIRRVVTALPFDRIMATFKIDNQFLRVDDLSVDVAGIPLRANPTIIPYQDVNTLLYLRSQGNDLSNIVTALDIPDWQLKPPFKGQVLLPLAFRNHVLTVNRANIQVDDGNIVYTGEAKAKPHELGTATAAHIQSGNVSVDQAFDDKDIVSFGVSLETAVQPGGQHWPIRVSEKRNILSLFTEPDAVITVPSEISSAIQAVFRQSESAMKQ